MTAVADYGQRLASVARHRLEQEARRRSTDGFVAVAPTEREALVLDAVDHELSVIDRERLSAGHPPIGPAESGRLVRSVVGATLGLGPVEEILADPSVEEVLGRWDHVVVHRPGRPPEVRTGPASPWRSERELVDWLVHAARSHGLTERAFNPGTPLLVTRIGPGLRLAATREVGRQVTFALRRNVLGRVDLDELVRRAMFEPVVADLFRAVMAMGEARLVFAGMTGAGKTTLARACLAELPATSHVIVMEDTAEIDLFDAERHPNVESWEVREPNTEGRGEISLADLVRHSLRHRPDWNVVGEVRDGRAATPMIAAMTAGMSSLTTVHARTAMSAIDKLQLYLGTGPDRLELHVAQLQLALAVDFVVHVRVDPHRRHRHVSEILHVSGFDGRRCLTGSIYRSDGIRAEGANVVDRDMADRLTAAGFDPRRLAFGDRR